MTLHEAFDKYGPTIREAMIDSYRDVLNSEGECQYKVYIWEDGQIERLLGPQGDNTYLAPLSHESRDLIYIDTVSEPNDIYTLTGCSPDDGYDEEEIIDSLVDDYALSIDDRIDCLIEEADREEEWKERTT